MPSFPYDPELARLENRGYGRGTGHVLLPNGTFVAVSQEEGALAFNNAVARIAYEEWTEALAAYVDPPEAMEPGEGSSLRAKDLKNRVVVLRAVGVGSDPAQVDKNGRPWEWTECNCWVVDGSAEPEAYEPALRVSWYRVRDQLARAGKGAFVVGRVVEDADRSIFLKPLDASKRGAVDAIWSIVEAQARDANAIRAAAVATEADEGYDEEPF